MQLHLMYGDRQVTLSCPWTKPMLAPITDGPLLDPFGSQQMFYPFHGYAGHNFHGRPGVRPIPPTLPPTTPSPLQDPNQQMFPQMYPRPMLDPYHSNSGGFPAVPQRQQSKYPMFRHHMHHFKNPVKAATPPTPPPAAQFDQFMGYPPRYPKFYGPKPFVRPHVQYPFMPKYPQDQVFPPHSPNPASSPVGSQSMIFD